MPLLKGRSGKKPVPAVGSDEVQESEPEQSQVNIIHPADEPARPMTVLCPLHRTPLPLQKDEKRKFVICLCNVPGNRHKGQVVWERKL